MSYELDYMHQILPDSIYYCFERRTKLVVMYRCSPHRMLGETEDTFRVCDALTGEFYGAGDTKAEANSDARYRLMDQSRKQFSAAQVA